MPQFQNRVYWAYPRTHAGVGIGPDDYSQQGLEDLALMLTLPTMLVLQPADDLETAQMVDLLGTDSRPAYLRLTRQDLPRVHDDKYRFVPGKFPQLVDGNDVALFATGGTVGFAVDAALALHADGIKARVYNASSVKPVDDDAIEQAARECQAGLVTIEDHNILGGLGGAVAESVTSRVPAKLLRLGVKDEFGESGDPLALYKKHGLDAEGIARDVRVFVRTQR